MKLIELEMCNNLKLRNVLLTYNYFTVKSLNCSFEDNRYIFVTKSVTIIMYFVYTYQRRSLSMSYYL